MTGNMAREYITNSFGHNWAVCDFCRCLKSPPTRKRSGSSSSLISNPARNKKLRLEPSCCYHTDLDHLDRA